MTKDLRLKIYPAVIGLLSAGLLISLLGNLNRSTQNERESEAPVVTELPPASPVPEESPVPEVSPSVTPTLTPPPPLPPGELVGVGRLRVSNQTTYPLRVALLRQADTPDTTLPDGERSFYNATAHWDFAPQEGRERGLLLSLPNNTLELKDGDIVVAFAQDGSRAYWGPYVLGRTALPAWNPTTREWDLDLKP